ncbi:MAG: hypothetical protein ACODAE_03370 [Gemmatimonadota bacterium]
MSGPTVAEVEPERGLAAETERDRRLEREGWTRRFVAAPPRLDEIVGLYRSMGREVRVEPLDEEDLREACAGCALALALFRVVYTRKP